MAKKTILYKDDLGYHTEEETTPSAQEVKSFMNIPAEKHPKTDTAGLMTRKAPILSPYELERLAKINAANLKRPLVRLGKKGDTFSFAQVKYQILERTDQFMFLECWQMQRNPDGSIPAFVPDSERKLGYNYFETCAVFIHQDPVLDGLYNDTGELSERREHIMPSANIEIRKVNAEGFPIDGPEGIGYNMNKEAVYQSYLDACNQYEGSVRNNAAMKKDKADQIASLDANGKRLAAFKEAKTKSFTELKQILKGVPDTESVLKDKKLLEKLDEYTRLESLSKLL